MTGAPPLSREDVLAIHSAAIARFGGADGVRDEGMLDSALAQPFQTFGGQELYATVAEKAARYAFGIISDHPFVDGNKRTATAVFGLCQPFPHALECGFADEQYVISPCICIANCK